MVRAFRGLDPLGGISVPLRRFVSSGGASYYPETLANQYAVFRADRLAFSDGDPISTWDGDVGGIDLVYDGNNSHRPTFRSAPTGFNGHPAVEFGYDDFLQAVVSITGTVLSVYTVCRRIGGSSDTSHIGMYDNATTEDYDSVAECVFAYEGGGSTLQTYRNGSKSTASHPGNGSTFVFATTFDGTTNVVYLNGTAQSGVGSSGSFGSNRLLVNARWTLTTISNIGNIYLAESWIYTAAHDATTAGNVITAMKNKYGV